MNKIISLVFLIAYLSLFSFNNKLIAQKSYPDAGSWNTLNIDYDINKKASFIFTQECRFKENFTRLNLFYTNIGFEYKVNDYFKAALVYRFIEKYMDDNSFSFRHRLMLDLSIKKKFNKFSLSYRQRLQAEERDIYSSNNGYIPEWYSRNKFTAKYYTGKQYTPYISAEFRYQIRNSREWQSDKTWHRDRYSIGLDYKLNKKSTFGIYYLIQREYNVSLPQNLYIAGLEYSLSL